MERFELFSREKKCKHQQPRNRSAEELLPGPVRFATQHTTAEESVDSKCILDTNKNLLPFFFLLHLLATTEQNHQDHEDVDVLDENMENNLDGITLEIVE